MQSEGHDLESWPCLSPHWISGCSPGPGHLRFLFQKLRMAALPADKFVLVKSNDTDEELSKAPGTRYALREQLAVSSFPSYPTSLPVWGGAMTRSLYMTVFQTWREGLVPRPLSYCRSKRGPPRTPHLLPGPVGSGSGASTPALAGLAGVALRSTAPESELGKA